MKEDVGKIRNIGIVGHGDSGKTSLVEAILFNANVTNRLGKIEDGTTVTDYDPDEIKRKISISSAVAFCDWKDCRINIIDTPGYGDFISDAKASLRVVESALFVVCSVSGVEVQTEKVWRFANEYNLPRLVFINKLDRERGDFPRTLESVRKRLSSHILPLQIPVGSEASFSGIVDLIKMKAYIYSDGTSGKMKEQEIPSELKEQAQEYREKMVESIAETDDELLTRYLEGETINDGELLSVMEKSISEGRLIPVLCGSATKNIGIRNLVDTIADLLPSPLERPFPDCRNLKNNEIIKRKIDSKESLSAFVFKTLADPYAGKLTLIRIFSGVLSSDSQIYDATKESKERIGQISLPLGRTHKPVDSIGPGEIGVVAKLRETSTGDTLCDEANPVIFDKIKFPEPAITFAIQPKAKGDEEKISNALARISEEDPTLKYKYDPEIKQLIVSGMGQLHIEVIMDKLQRKFGVEIDILPPRVPYKETIKSSSKVQGKYKRQTGGRGQYGDVWLEIESLERGMGFEFVDKIFGGVVPRQYIPAVEKGVKEAMDRGVIAGYPVVDVRVTLYDGSYHTVDSSEMAFKIASSMAFQKGIVEANPILLEPIMNIEVTAPGENTGDVIGDLNSRRGRIMGVDSEDDYQAVKAQVPLSEVLKYEPDLRSMTGGRGTYSMEFSHYEEVPSFLAEKIIAQAKAAKEEEK